MVSLLLRGVFEFWFKPEAFFTIQNNLSQSTLLLYHLNVNWTEQGSILLPVLLSRPIDFTAASYPDRSILLPVLLSRPIYFNLQHEQNENNKQMKPIKKLRPLNIH